MLRSTAIRQILSGDSHKRQGSRFQWVLLRPFAVDLHKTESVGLRCGVVGNFESQLARTAQCAQGASRRRQVAVNERTGDVSLAEHQSHLA